MLKNVVISDRFKNAYQIFMQCYEKTNNRYYEEGKQLMQSRMDEFVRYNVSYKDELSWPDIELN